MMETLRAELRWACKRNVREVELLNRSDLDKDDPDWDKVCGGLEMLVERQQTPT